MEEEPKKTRARSKKAKQAQMVRIIEEGRKLFLKYGAEAMSMRKLAQNLGMGSGSASSLYTYVTSKRELWFAILKNDFQVFEGTMEQLYESHTGTVKELLIKIATFYLNFAIENPSRYKMMFEIPPPFSKRIGKREEKYESRSIYFLQEVVRLGVSRGEFQEKKVENLSFFLWGLLHGPLIVIETELFGDAQRLISIKDKQNYIQFLIDKIKKIIEVI